MRMAALVLLMLNLALFAWLHGLFGRPDGEGREPGRLDQQLAAEKIRILSERDLQQLKRRASDATAPVQAADAPACLELGEFTGDGALQRLRDRLTELKLGDKFSEQSQEQAAWYAVTVPGIKSRAEADRRAEELRGLGERDALVEQVGSPSRFAVQLGAWRDRDQARKYAARLEKKGVKSIQVSDAALTLSSTRVRLRGLDAAAAAQVNALQAEFPQQKIQACPADAAP